MHAFQLEALLPVHRSHTVLTSTCFHTTKHSTALVLLLDIMAVNPRSRETRQRLEKCWSIDTDWNLIPSELKEVMLVTKIESFV